MVFLLASLFSHLFLEVVIVLDNGVAFTLQSLISVIVFTLNLGSLESKLLGLFLNAVDL